MSASSIGAASAPLSLAGSSSSLLIIASESALLPVCHSASASHACPARVNPVEEDAVSTIISRTLSVFAAPYSDST